MINVGKYEGDNRFDVFVLGLSMFLLLMGKFPKLTENDWLEINKANNLEEVNIVLTRALETNNCAESDELMMNFESPMDSSGQMKLVLKNN